MLILPRYYMGIQNSSPWRIKCFPNVRTKCSYRIEKYNKLKKKTKTNLLMHLIVELNWQNSIGELEDRSEFIHSEQKENKLKKR